MDVFGQPADLDPIRKIADDYKIKMIEDSCEALGAEYKGKPAGTFGDYAVFAFYPNKQITTGEGGVIITSDDKAAGMMRALRNQGRAPGDTWLQHTYLGYNYRLDEMSAALGTVQMTRLDELLKKRDRVANWYTERLSEIPGVEPPVVKSFTTRMSWFVYVVRFDKKINRDSLAKRLEARGVHVRPYFLPIHLQPYMAERFGYREGDFPVTEDLGQTRISIALLRCDDGGASGFGLQRDQRRAEQGIIANVIARREHSERRGNLQIEFKKVFMDYMRLLRSK